MIATRKTVTVLFCDLVGSTALGDGADPEVLRSLMTRYHAEVRAILERHGGTVEKFIGDAAMAVFGIPHAHEDDALRAARAAVEVQGAVATLGIQVRIGIDTGEVVAAAGETLVTGDVVNVAARLEQAAEAGEILIGQATERLVRNAVQTEPIAALALKGKVQPVPAYRLREVRADAPALPRHGETPLIGREVELDTLESTLGAAIEERQPRMVTVIGPPGIGKSRLVHELTTRSASEAWVLVGRCLSYGQGITYWPLADIAGQVGDLRSVLGESEEAEVAASRIGAALGEGAASSEEIAWGFRKLFEALARDRPLIVVVDDIQWAEPALLDLLEYLPDFARDAALLVLCTARPEIHELRPSWASPRPNALLITLQPLDPAQSELLVDELGDLSPDRRVRIVEAAEGNPLFVEQLVAMQAEASDGQLEIPPTIQALLTARIDRLEPDERAVIERASIEGRLFHRGSVQALLPEGARAGVGSRLLALVRKQFVRADRAQLPGDDAFRFDHILIRDAAYGSLPKALRAELHERFTDWLASRLGEDAPGEILGYHLEQAHRYRRELGQEDEQTHGLALRAGRILAEAGRRAHARGDDGATSSLLERATHLLPQGDSAVPDLLALLGSSTFEAGNAPAALEILRRAQSAAAQLGQRAIELRARMSELAILRGSTDPGRGAEAALREANAAIIELQRLDDAESLARAWRAVIEIGFLRSDMGLVGEASSQLLDCARRAGIRRDQVWAVRGLAAALTYGPAPVEEAIARAEEGLAGFREEGAGEDHLGLLYAYAGRFDDAERAMERARRLRMELGQQIDHAGLTLDLAWIRLLAAQPERAEPELRAAAGVLERAGERGLLASVEGLLAEVVYRLGRHDEAEQWTRRCERTAAPEDIEAQALWRATRAKVLARRGEAEAAVRLSGEALELVRRTDHPQIIGDALVDGAEVHRLVGRRASVRPLLEEALAVYERKGIVPSIERTRALLAELEVVAT